MTSPIRLGLAGVGTHGMRYGRHIARDVAESTLVAVTRRDREAGRRVAAELGCEYEPDVGALAARPDIDALVVVTPPAAHLAAAVAGLEAGKPVLVEKPMVASSSESDALARAAARAGCPVMVAQTLRYNVVLGTVRARLGELGRIVRVTMSQRLEPANLAWQRQHEEADAGAILLTGVHLFDAVRWLLDDEIGEVYCRTGRIQNPAHEDFFAASVHLLRTGIQADLEISKYTRSRSCRIEVVGEKGQLHGDYWNHRLTLTRGREVEDLPLPPEAFTVEAAVRDFCRRLIGGDEMPITIADGRRSIEVAEACYASARANRPTRLA